jgi:hypothetical protein
MNDFNTWSGILAWHIQRYPAMNARDVYKLLYQGLLGPEHSMPTAEIFRARLEEELADLQPDASQPLLEDLRPDGALQRIYLRPWLARGQDLSVLVQACLEPAGASGAHQKSLCAPGAGFWSELRKALTRPSANPKRWLSRQCCRSTITRPRTTRQAMPSYTSQPTGWSPAMFLHSPRTIVGK